MRYLFLIPLLLLGACNHKEEVIFNCPQIGFIKNYDVVELKNKEIIVTMNGVSGSCEPVEKNMAMEITLPFAATSKAKSHKDETVEVSYAISLLTPDEGVLSKKIFTTTLSFDENGHADSEEEHTIDLPLDSMQKAYRYKIVIGFIKQGEVVKNGK